MARLSSKLRSIGNEGHGGIMHWCPGCGHAHVIYTTRNLESIRPTWTWNGSVDKPTCMPSVRIWIPLKDGTEKTLCHYFLTDGAQVFCGDSQHEYAGKTVLLWDIPDLYGGGE